MTLEVTFDTYPVGAALGPVSLDVTEEMSSRFALAVDSDCAWYRGPSPFGGPIAPYTAIEQVMLVTLGATYRVTDAPGGTVQYGLDVAYHTPARVGTRLTIRGQTLDKLARPGRYQTSFAYEVANDAAGITIMTGTVSQAHLLGGASTAAPRQPRPADTVSSEDEAPPGPLLTLRDGPAGLVVGARMAPLEIPMTLDSMRRYSAWPRLADYGRELENQHTSEVEARRLGRPGVIAMGSHLVGYLEEYLTRWFGRPWLAGGHLRVRFVGMVLVGDTVVVSAATRACTRTEKARQIELDVVCRTKRGTTAISGTALIPLPCDWAGREKTEHD